MIWRFTIIDSLGASQIIDEPIGWDGVQTSFNRNLINHGIIVNIDTDGFQYVGNAFELLRDEYDLNGSDGQMELLIEYDCNNSGTYTQYFRGKFDFNTYSRVCSDECLIECDVIASKCTDIFLNRISQDVVLQTTTDLNGDTIAPLDEDTILIEGQNILLQNKGYNTAGTDCVGTGNYAVTGNKYLYSPVLLPKVPIIEIGDFALNNAICSFVEKNGGIDPIDFTSLSDFAGYGQFLSIYERTPDPLNCVDNDATIEYRCKGSILYTPQFNGSLTTRLIFAKYDLNTATLAVINANSIGVDGRAISTGVTNTVNFDIAFSSTPAYDESQILLYYIFINPFISALGSGDYDIEIRYDAGDTLNYFTMALDSACDETTAIGYRLDKTLEFLPLVYSGADCATPSVLIDCFDNYHLTNGLHIRNVTEPSSPKMFLNFQSLFDNVRKIFNIGWGFDSNETVLKIAELPEFYKSTQAVNVGSVMEVKFVTAKELIWSVINVGYNKWEAEEYNGLDEMNTSRQYRRNVNSQMQELDLLCDLITAGYTIEITRRKNQTKTGTSDWRYDNDTFLISTEVVDDVLLAYRGVDAGAANIYSPATRMNYRLTPVRNLLAWFKSISAPRPTTSGEILTFNSGEGNYIAEGQMNTQCFLEGEVIAENQDIDTSIFDDITDALPIWETQFLVFNAPLSMEQFEDIKLDPYGLVTLECMGVTYEGNIVQITHNPNEGDANFKLLWHRP